VPSRARPNSDAQQTALFLLVRETDEIFTSALMALHWLRSTPVSSLVMGSAARKGENSKIQESPKILSTSRITLSDQSLSALFPALCRAHARATSSHPSPFLSP
jgi:hypothetical protein